MEIEDFLPSINVGDILSFNQQFYRGPNVHPPNPEQWRVLEVGKTHFVMESLFDGLKQNVVIPDLII